MSFLVLDRSNACTLADSIAYRSLPIEKIHNSRNKEFLRTLNAAFMAEEAFSKLQSFHQL